MKKLLFISLLIGALGFSASIPINNGGFSATTYYVVPTSTSNYKQATQTWGARGISANVIKASVVTVNNLVALTNVQIIGATNANLISSTNAVKSTIGSAESTGAFFSYANGLEIMTNSNSPIGFGTNVTAGSATPKMVLLANGRLGIGTITPGSSLDVNGTASASVVQANTANIATVVSASRLALSGQTGCSYFAEASQTIANASNVVISFNTQLYDNASMMNTNNATITIPAGQSGVYYVAAQVTFAGNATGTARTVNVKISGTNRITAQSQPVANVQSVAVQKVLVLTAGQTVKVDAYQDSGGDMALGSSNEGAQVYIVVQRLF